MTITSKSGYVLKGRVIDGTLEPPLERGAVVLEGNRIAWVGHASGLPPQYGNGAYEVIDLPDRSITPGLIDGHTHISFGESRSEEENALYTPVEFRTAKALFYAKKILQAGVTSAFDAATTYAIAQAVRDAIDSGMFPGPRFTVSGKQLTNHQGLEDSFPSNLGWPPGQSAVLVKTREDLIEAIRLQVKEEVDAIKVSGSNDNLITPDALGGSAFTLEEFKVIAEETHRLGKALHGPRALGRLRARRGASWFRHHLPRVVHRRCRYRGMPQEQVRDQSDPHPDRQPDRREPGKRRRFERRGISA
jgi:imidazolonepropionase-like amidohydrolase